MTSKLELPKLYAIIDASMFADTTALCRFALALLDGDVTLLQYRNKNGTAREMLAQARELRRISNGRATLIMNDRADLALVAGFDGVHVGQDDLSVDGARAIVGTNMVVGVSTHNPEQVRRAATLPVDYIAVGPVFKTSSKANPDPVIGVEGIRRARQLTDKPLVAIGGITRANARSVVDAGADSIAVISDLLTSPREAARQYLNLLT